MQPIKLKASSDHATLAMTVGAASANLSA